MTLLAVVARYGRLSLIAGLLAGLALPGLAATLRPWLPHLIAALLFLAALRIGPQATFGRLQGLGRTVATVLILQLAAPLLVLAGLSAAGLAATPAGLALVLVLAAPPVTGSPHFTVLMGGDPAIAMRLLLVGTALFPMTALAALAVSPVAGTLQEAATGALRLGVVIACSVGTAFAIRAWVWPHPDAGSRAATDGLAVLLLGVVVIGLMSAVGPALRHRPLDVGAWLGLACAVNFGVQLLAWRWMPVGDARDRTGTSFVAGNRNVALFLVALPPQMTDALLLFIGCYQIPMYLTPAILGRVLASRGRLTRPR